MKPLIKWVGGKRRFVKRISEELSDFEINNYYEPFAGSAALMFALEPKNKILINDLNENLINFYIQARDNYSSLYKKINKLIDENKTKEEYYALRAKYNDSIKVLDINNAALFFYLNKMGFNGIYRVNGSGFFNTPRGSNHNPYVPTLEEFSEASELLSRAVIEKGNWHEHIKRIVSGDLIYLDPPYYPDATSQFVGYTDPRFGVEEHVEMINKVKGWMDNGARIIISNSNSMEFYEKLKSSIGEENIKYDPISTNRAINPNAKNKERFKEALYVIEEGINKNENN